MATEDDVTSQKRQEKAAGPEDWSPRLVRAAATASIGSTAMCKAAHELRNCLAIISANSELLFAHPGDREILAECEPRIFGAMERRSDRETLEIAPWKSHLTPVAAFQASTWPGFLSILHHRPRPRGCRHGARLSLHPPAAATTDNGAWQLIHTKPRRIKNGPDEEKPYEF